MSDGNKVRHYGVFKDLYSSLLKYYKHSLKAKHQSHIIDEIQNHKIKIIDSTTISLCLSLFNWAKYRTAKGGLKIHTVWDDQLGLSDEKDHDILKDEIIVLTSKKAMKQNLQIKTFLGTSENAVKSQIYVALICYLLLELIKRFYSDKNTAFSNFCEKIRVCLMHYLTLSYVCNELKPIVKKVKKPPENTLFDRDNSAQQTSLPL
ncbi:Hypothetical protein Ccan_12510 [Capnocytophaga canimorsus Cc5]|uniref:Transposase n=2 Tax=Capnocytophaga TaxID=1016 RepID=F9YPM1_CAPCC|nr:Hypothetical protein Ccan_12510 [Capnocytophaga canimorsus Cc5]